MTKKREVWIDMMKVLGMYFIVLGHLFPKTFTSMLYAFSVPLFFTLSGYCTPFEIRNTQEKKIRIKKIFHTLILPYFYLSMVNLALTAVESLAKHNFDFSSFIKSIGAICVGADGIKDILIGCSTLWFVYSLVIIKFLSVYVSPKYSLFIALVFSILSYFQNHFERTNYWAITNVFLAYPFFALGQLCRTTILQGLIDFLIHKSKKYWNLIISITLFATVYLISYYNGSAWMYMGEYGNNIITFYCGAVLGIIAVFLIAVTLNKFDSTLIRLLSSGNILILAFQWKICCYTRNYADNLLGDSTYKDVYLSIAAILIMLAFIPIIKFFSIYLPAFMGGRKQ